MSNIQDGTPIWTVESISCGLLDKIEEALCVLRVSRPELSIGNSAYLELVEERIKNRRRFQHVVAGDVAQVDRSEALPG